MPFSVEENGQSISAATRNSLISDWFSSNSHRSTAEPMAAHVQSGDLVTIAKIDGTANDSPVDEIATRQHSVLLPLV